MIDPRPIALAAHGVGMTEPLGQSQILPYLITTAIM